MRFALLISYDGTNFSGWQNQPEKRTVQKTLEEAGETLFSQKITLVGSGRTDAGVHALGQVAHFDAETSVPPEKIAYLFNRVLPSDVKVLKSAKADPDFDCCRAAKKKCYSYFAYFKSVEHPLLERFASKLPFYPDLSSMREAIKLIKGKHDFAAFRAAGFSSKTSEREIFRAEVKELEKGIFCVEVEGNGFLYHMMRILCGELFLIGSGKEEHFSLAFQTKRRDALGKTMPAKGLLLKSVDYGFPLFEANETER